MNLTRREYIHPHRVNCGLKLPEWWGCNSAVVRRMKQMWPDASDDVRAVSDYGNVEQLSGEPQPEEAVPGYGEVEDTYRDVSTERQRDEAQP